MKVFLGEYICGGGMRRKSLQAISTSLRLEGGAMLAALAEDLAKVCDLCVPIDPRISPELPRGDYHEMEVTQPLWQQWVRAAQGCDAAVVIAPETDGVLAKAVGMLRAGGIDVISSSGDFLRIASDKQLTARAFHSARVPHPVTYLHNDPRSLRQLEAFSQFIVKPRDGCGTERVCIHDGLKTAQDAATDADILQAFVPGRPVSAAVIVNGTELVSLPAVAQVVDLETCAYRGGQGPLSEVDQRRVAALTQLAISAMPPSPRGFIGFDIVLAEELGGDVVIEVNSRLTTSYVGLRKMVAGNLAARMLGLECGPVQCVTGVDSVRWTADGHVWVNDIEQTIG